MIMLVIGLSGGIASGKNFVAEIFKKNGALVFDADEEVHKLLESDKSTITEISKNFPLVIVSKKIDRKILGEIVFADGEKLKILEKILHPKVREKYREFLKKARQENHKLVVLNIPLLLENKGYKCDKIIAVITSKIVQKQRFLEREKAKNPQNFVAQIKNLEKKFEQIRSQQISNLERKKQADFIIKNDDSRIETAKQVCEILRKFSDEFYPKVS